MTLLKSKSSSRTAVVGLTPAADVVFRKRRIAGGLYYVFVASTDSTDMSSRGIDESSIRPLPPSVYSTYAAGFLFYRQCTMRRS